MTIRELTLLEHGIPFPRFCHNRLSGLSVICGKWIPARSGAAKKSAYHVDSGAGQNSSNENPCRIFHYVM